MGPILKDSNQDISAQFDTTIDSLGKLQLAADVFNNHESKDEVDDEDNVKNHNSGESSDYDSQSVTKDNYTGESDENDDTANEFLNSSSFLSNSQIIKTSNVNNLKLAVNDLTPANSSPTRGNNRDLGKPAKRKQHFQLFVPLKDEKDTLINDLSDASDNDDEEEEDEVRESDQVRKSQTNENTPRSINSKSSRSTKYIDIDNPDSTPKLPRMHPDATPWRKLRPPSLYLKEPTPQIPSASSKIPSNIVQSLFEPNFDQSGKSSIRSVSLFEPSSSDGLAELSGSTTATSSHELENLRKQITGYKLQLRLLTEFIRDIIKSSDKGVDLKQEIMSKLERENDLLLSQKELLQKELKSSTGANSVDEEKYNSKIKEVLELKNDLIATRDLNNELNTYLEDLKAQSNSQQESLKLQAGETQRWTDLINNTLSLLLDILEGDSAKAIVRARDESNSVDTKLKVITLAINELLEKYDNLSARLATNVEKTTVQSSVDSLTASDKAQIQGKLFRAKQIENDLKQLVVRQSSSFSTLKAEYNSLKLQFKENLQFIANLKKLLGEKRTAIADLNDKIIDLESQLEELKDFKNEVNKEKETQLLKNRLNLAKLNHSKEVERLQFEIEELKLILENHAQSQNDKILSEELLRKQREIDDLNNEIAILNSKFLDQSRDHESTVYNLKNLVHSSRNELDTLQIDYNNLKQQLKEAQEEISHNERDYKKKLEHAAKELNLAVAKQRGLAAEKSKLTFALEDSKRERSTLLLNNNTLTEKVSRLSYQVSTLTNYEVGFNSLFQLQASYLKTVLHHFESVLEESSVAQAQQKIKKLLDDDLEFEQAHSISRSLFAYLENATSSLIEDHSELLMRFNHDDSGEEINRLRDEIDGLNEELQWCYTNGQFKNSVTQDSPRTKLRIDELEKKRKAERERRKQEHESFGNQIRDLEHENRELREKLKRYVK